MHRKQNIDIIIYLVSGKNVHSKNQLTIGLSVVGSLIVLLLLVLIIMVCACYVNAKRSDQIFKKAGELRPFLNSTYKKNTTLSCNNYVYRLKEIPQYQKTGQ